MSTTAKTQAERKREQRKREVERGAKRIGITFYRGSLKAIDELCTARGLTGSDKIPELITSLIHEAHKNEIVTGHEKDSPA